MATFEESIRKLKGRRVKVYLSDQDGKAFEDILRDTFPDFLVLAKSDNSEPYAYIALAHVKAVELLGEPAAR